MVIGYQNIVLRDMVKSDIEDYVRWFTTETEWGNWDAPWEPLDGTEEAERKSWTEYYASVKDLPDDELRWKFEIEFCGKHIGWVSSYCIDEAFAWVSADSVQEGQRIYRAVGIDICDKMYQGKGLGTKALEAFIQYYRDKGYSEIFTQTWSGNTRMIKLAERLGFKECGRKIGSREALGEKFDGLTFVL